MPRKTSNSVGHTGKTGSGHTRDVKVERLGPVTVYRRGTTYYLYYREKGATRRCKVNGNLNVARATASKVAAALGEGRPSPVGHSRTAPESLVAGYLDYVTEVQRLAPRTRDRYRAALTRFLDFVRDVGIVLVDAVDEVTVEDFVRWLRGQRRTRNGAAKGRKDVYKTSGIRVILTTCRIAFNWGAKRRMLPAFAENPFSSFPIDTLRDPDEGEHEDRIFTPAQEAAFFSACDAWQQGIFVALAALGLRVGEMTHLLVEDVDLERGVIEVRSKPELFWSVKTKRRRTLPLGPEIRELLVGLIGSRTAGFVFLNREYTAGRSRPTASFASPRGFLAHVRRLVDDRDPARTSAGEEDRRRVVTAFCRSMGQIPEKRVRQEFMKLTEAIGCPEFTRAHDLRHLFTTRAQERGVNPLVVQELLGHTTLAMTSRYTHVSMDAKREAVARLSPGRGASGEQS
jgi:integrase